jgi:hypothetical protein
MHTQHFFLLPPIFLNVACSFSRGSYFVIAASVVQHSILLSRLLVDSVFPVACHMRNYPVRLGTEQFAAQRINYHRTAGKEAPELQP